MRGTSRSAKQSFENIGNSSNIKGFGCIDGELNGNNNYQNEWLQPAVTFEGKEFLEKMNEINEKRFGEFGEKVIFI